MTLRELCSSGEWAGSLPARSPLDQLRGGAEQNVDRGLAGKSSCCDSCAVLWFRRDVCAAGLHVLLTVSVTVGLRATGGDAS